MVLRASVGECKALLDEKQLLEDCFHGSLLLLCTSREFRDGNFSC